MVKSPFENETKGAFHRRGAENAKIGPFSKFSGDHENGLEQLEASTGENKASKDVSKASRFERKHHNKALIFVAHVSLHH